MSENIYYLFYAIIVVVFIIVLKMPKKDQDKNRKKPISTSKKFNKHARDQHNTIKDI